MSEVAEKKPCAMCFEEFAAEALDFLGRCEPCFRRYLENPPACQPVLFQKTGNPHNPKETKAYVNRLERKRWTPGGTEHNYVKRSYVFNSR